MPSDLIEKIRKIRTQQDLVLRPSPYLRDKFVDEYGEEQPVKLRNYQSQGVLNSLQIERMISGDDCGLGKTLVALSTIGYIWLKEPEYVPIIITTKSALFQWESETEKFMQNMEAVTVQGPPFQRHKIYENFFSNYSQEKKRLLILSYDHVMYDMNEAVIKEKKKSPRRGFKEELKSAKADHSSSLTLFEAEKEKFDQHFLDRPWEIHNYLEQFLSNEIKPSPPSIFTEDDSKTLLSYYEQREAVKACARKIQDLKDEQAPPKRVLGIIDYIQAFRSKNPNSKFILVMDEFHKLKNHKSQFHEKVALIAKESQRAYGLTATPVKNRLMEFWALFKIINPALFPKISHFHNDFCIIKLQPIGGGRSVPLVVGYKNLDRFVSIIEPYYLSRKKHEVAKELPELISMEIECELTEIQEELYDLAESGLLDKSEDPDVQNADLLSAMVRCQQAVDAPGLIIDESTGKPFIGNSSKIEALIDLLRTDAEDEKVIVFSKFEKMISIVESSLQLEKINYVRITGAESNPKIREANKAKFQDKNSGVNVILITTAGSESLNLHSAEHLAILDLPYSYGDYLQLIGRAIRLGSKNKAVVAHHFLGRKRDGQKTIDHQVLKALRAKKKLADKVAGENLKDGLKFKESDAVHDILSSLRGERNKDSSKEKPNKSVAVKKSSQKKSIIPVDDVPIMVSSIDFSDM